MKRHFTIKKSRSFFYSFPKEYIQDYVYHSQSDFDKDSLEDLKNFFQDHYDANPPKKTDCKDHEGDKGQPPCCNQLLSHLVKMAIQMMRLPLCLLAAPLNDLVNDLALVNALMPVRHVPVTNADLQRLHYRME